MNSDIEKLLKYEPEAENNACFIIDYSCLFPFANQEAAHLDLEVNGERITDYKLNHRFPNKNYVTFSKKYRRKVCSYGYPIVMPFSKKPEKIELAAIMTVHNGTPFRISFSVMLMLTPERPYTTLRIRYHFNDEASNVQFMLRSDGYVYDDSANTKTCLTKFWATENKPRLIDDFMNSSLRQDSQLELLEAKTTAKDSIEFANLIYPMVSKKEDLFI
ncbi:MAG: hypothetical protein IJI83_02850 [Oscillospiraceae bacterium]|nr:hypothetical protein [Oscillospiraceae bacterium]